jgi:transposase
VAIKRDLLEALWAVGITVSLVHAGRIRAFARARGLLAKTEQIDATALREFGELLRPEEWVAPSPSRQRLAALVQRRNQLLNILTVVEQRLAQSCDTVALKMSEPLLKEPQKYIAQMEALIATQIDEDDTLKGQGERL